MQLGHRVETLRLFLSSALSLTHIFYDKMKQVRQPQPGGLFPVLAARSPLTGLWHVLSSGFVLESVAALFQMWCDPRCGVFQGYS